MPVASGVDWHELHHPARRRWRVSEKQRLIFPEQYSQIAPSPVFCVPHRLVLMYYIVLFSGRDLVEKVERKDIKQV